MAMPTLPDGYGYYAGEKLPYGIGKDVKGTITIGEDAIEMYPTSMSANLDGEIKEYKGPTGQIISLIVPTRFYTLSGDGWVKLGDSGKVKLSSLKKGESVTIPASILEQIELPTTSTDKFRVDSVSVQFSNEDVAKVSYTFKEYPQIAAD